MKMKRQMNDVVNDLHSKSWCRSEVILRDSRETERQREEEKYELY